MQAVCKNEPAALAEFIKKAADYIEKSAKAYIRSDGRTDKNELIKDTVQEVILKLIEDDRRALKKYNGDYALATWLSTITKNHISSYFRKNKHKFEELDESRDGLSLITPTFEKFEQKFQRLLALGSGTLMPVEEECLELKYLIGNTQKEIADILGIPQNTVASHINRGKKKLKEVLQFLRINTL